MKRNDAEQIGEMIRKFFRQNALEAPLNEYRLIQAWKDVVGPAITKYTSNLYIKNQILYVNLSRSSLLYINPKIFVRSEDRDFNYEPIFDCLLMEQSVSR